MNEKNFEYLKNQVTALGFPDRIVEQISDYKKVNNQAFHIYYFNQVEDNLLMYDLRFAKDAEDTYQLKEYELTYKQINIPDLDIQGTNTKDLDGKLKEVNNWYDKFLEHGIENSMSRQAYEKVTDFIKTTNNDLYKLAEIEKGEEVAKLLMYKYFPESEYEKIFSNYQEMQRQHEHKHIFPVNDNIALTAMEAYQILKAEVNSVREHYTSTIASEHVIIDEAFHHINSELLKGNKWVAYNTSSYFLDRDDVYFFNSKDEANDFAESNISEFDNYRVINGEQLSKTLTERFRNETDLSTQKTNIMNEKNFDYLKGQVKFTGFGDALENDLKERMQKQSPEFQIYHNTKFGNDIAVATLHFRKSEQSDIYFFNKYNLTLKQENSPDMMEQTFYINKGNNITLKEAYNLMSGRAINKDLTNKEGQVYNAWMQMDFKETDKNGNYQLKHYHTNYGFDLEKELAKHPIKELTNEQDKTRLMESLQKGNRQAVTFIKDGNEQRMFIEANPRFKSLNVYDSNMQRVHSQSQKEKNEPEQSVKQEAKKESQKHTDDDSEGVPKTKHKQSRKKGQSIS